MSDCAILGGCCSICALFWIDCGINLARLRVCGSCADRYVEGYRDGLRAADQAAADQSAALWHHLEQRPCPPTCPYCRANTEHAAITLDSTAALAAWWDALESCITYGSMSAAGGTQ